MRASARSIAVIFIAASALYGQRASAVFIDTPFPQVVAGDSAQLSGTAYDSNGVAVKGAAFTWSSSNTSVLTVDPGGLVHAVTLGWADIFADTAGARGTLRLQVVPLAINVNPANRTVHTGDAVQYSADVLDINSLPLAGVALQWRVYGANSQTTNSAGIDLTGLLSTYGFGTFFVEGYFNYTVGAGPFIPRYFGNTLVTVLPPDSYKAVKLLDNGSVRQSFQLRPRRGLMSVNDAGQIAYVGSLEGFADAALLWQNGAFTTVAAAGNPAVLPGSSLLDIDDLAINNNGEVSTRCVLAPIRNAILFGAADGTSRLLLFDGSSGGSAANIRNFQTTRFGLNDDSVTLFRADYQNIGNTTVITGLFTVDSFGRVALVVPAATPLAGLGTTYTFDRDFGIANDGTMLFFATGASSRALYRMGPDSVITRVIGIGDLIGGLAVTSLGNVIVGKNGQYAVYAFNGTQNLLLYSGTPSSRKQLPLNNYRNTFAIGASGDAVFYADPGAGLGLYRWNGTAVQPALTIGTPSPSGDLYSQFDSAGITSAGEIIVQARTLNNLLLVVNTGASTGAKPSIVFQTGDRVNASAGPAFFNFVPNSHMGNPMLKTNFYTANVFELNSGALLPRLVDGDLLPGSWVYEGNEDVRRNADGDLIVSTDDSLTQVGTASSNVLAHFPQRQQAGTVFAGFQVAANTGGTVAITGGTSFGPQQISVVQNGVANMIAYVGSNSQYRTASPGGGFFSQSLDIGVDDIGNVFANLRVNGGPDGLFEYSQSKWSALVKVGDTFDGRPVTAINQIRVTGNACFALITTQGGLNHISRFQDGAWTDLINYGDGLPIGGNIFGIATFDANRQGGVAAVVFGSGGAQYLVYSDGIQLRVAVDNNRQLVRGEYLIQLFQVSLNDDARIFLTAINQYDQMVLYEFDPLF
jgi:hypothetical protein